MRIAYWTFAAIAVASQAHAAPILIDFESVSTTDQSSYIESGVTFTTVTGSEFIGTGTPNNTQGLLANVFQGTDIRPLFRADIFGGASFVSVDLGDFGDDDDLLVLNAFDASDNLVDLAIVPIASDFQGMMTLSVSGSNIAYVFFGGVDDSGGSSVYADNFTFEPAAASAVPEPASLAMTTLGGLGLVGGWYRKRKRRD